MTKNVIIMGAAGRDFHDFLVYFKKNPEFRVVAFTATQIPYISDRTFPASLAGPSYPNGIPIYPEKRLEELIDSLQVNDVYFAYSDVSDVYVMNLASIAQSKGAGFHLLGPGDTMIRASKPVIAVVADRTGAGKSTISRMVADILIKMGLKPVAVRHPMPYGDLSDSVQRFETYDDLDRHHTTIEEREEYEGHIDRGIVVYAGVDYEAILQEAEKEGDVVIWDGGNNDFSFYKPDLTITVVDPMRPGDESRYYPGATNMRLADVLVINKVNVAPKKTVDEVARACRRLNPGAVVVKTNSVATLDKPELVRRKRVLVVEDGPSVTHGGLSEGAGAVAARSVKATLADPRPKAVGSIRRAYRRFPKLGKVIPALGYSPDQLKELERSINGVACDAVVLGTPSDLTRIIKIRKPVARVRFEASEAGGRKLESVLRSNERLRSKA
ncbi:MAG: GTPase [Nitrososphaerota archaeon]|nr:GTPase [Nitrososphaerota archaeon]MDG7023562.1 GTPase [Nitrososphaerota archaeon]